MKTTKLGIVIEGKRIAKFILQPGGDVLLGTQSGKTNFVKVEHPHVSREHAQLICDEHGSLYILDLNSTNGVYINGNRIQSNSPVKLSQNTTISLVRDGAVQLVFNPDDYPSQGQSRSAPSVVGEKANVLSLFDKKNTVVIGRSSASDIVLKHATISKRHAQIERKSNNQFFIKDLGSLNGTFVNGKRVVGEVKVDQNDAILVGRYQISLEGKAKQLSDEIALRADRIVKQYANGYQGLKESTFEIPTSTMLAVMGPSGCGKSTLLKALCGDAPPTSGSIHMFGLEFNSNYEFLKTQIGYVPQDDIVHGDLTVYQSLYYSAKLRLPGATDENIREKIEEVLKELNIEHIRDSLLTSTSGGQRKRVSIAVEILTDPLVLFLDEPTSPLDPQTIEEFLGILKRLSERGTTVIIVTHKPDDLEFMDTVVFMAEGGFIAYQDTVDQYLSYFKVNSIRDVYGELEGDKAKPWVSKWQSRMNGETTGTASKKELEKGKANVLSQLRWLTQRLFRRKFNDSRSMLILFAQAPVVAVLICLVFPKISPAVLFLVTICAIWFGASNAVKEIVGELPIYRRERMFNQSIFPYIFSKLVVLSFFAAVQAILFTLILSLFYASDGPTDVALFDPVKTFGWILLVSVSGSLMGLFISSMVSNPGKATALVPMALIPQIILAGVVAPIPSRFVEYISYITLSRWGTEGFGVIQEKLVVPMPKVVQKEITEGTEPGSALTEPQFDVEPTDSVMGAVQQLNEQYHESYQDFGDMQSSFGLNLIAVTTIAVLFLLGTFIAMKRKDPIKRK